MEVVRHADEQVQPNVELLHTLAQALHKTLAVGIVPEEVRPLCLPVPTIRQVTW